MIRKNKPIILFLCVTLLALFNFLVNFFYIQQHTIKTELHNMHEERCQADFGLDLFAESLRAGKFEKLAKENRAFPNIAFEGVLPPSLIAALQEEMDESNILGNQCHYNATSCFLKKGYQYLKSTINDESMMGYFNCFMFLNNDWHESYGGDLEMWSQDNKQCQARIAPLEGRLIVFTTTDYSWHGHPEPLTAPNGRLRRSIAFYYYTTGDRNPEDGSEENAVFCTRPFLWWNRKADDVVGADFYATSKDGASKNTRAQPINHQPQQQTMVPNSQQQQIPTNTTDQTNKRNNAAQDIMNTNKLARSDPNIVQQQQYQVSTPMTTKPPQQQSVDPNSVAQQQPVTYVPNAPTTNQPPQPIPVVTNAAPPAVTVNPLANTVPNNNTPEVTLPPAIVTTSGAPPSADKAVTKTDAATPITATNNPLDKHQISTKPSLESTVVPASTPEPLKPSTNPISQPTIAPTTKTSLKPTLVTATEPMTPKPFLNPTSNPTSSPSIKATTKAMHMTATKPALEPTTVPASAPELLKPTVNPMLQPTIVPTTEPITSKPFLNPTSNPTSTPSIKPITNTMGMATSKPTFAPTLVPAQVPESLKSTVNRSSTKEAVGNQANVPSFIAHIHDYSNKALNVTSTTNQLFRLPTDNDYLLQWGGIGVFLNSTQRQVKYLRNTTEIMSYFSKSDCASTLDVLAWLMDKINEKKSLSIIAYGNLIHVHREKDFINKTTGDYIDDDVDLWVSFQTAKVIAELEKELFSLFRWTVRSFVNADNYVVFVQTMAACGHQPSTIAGKIKSSKPAIEMYLLPLVKVNSTYFFKDLWHGAEFTVNMIYPPKRIDLVSSGTTQPLHLQVPRDSFGIMECLYGNWRIPSKEHVKRYQDCKNYKRMHV